MVRVNNYFNQNTFKAFGHLGIQAGLVAADWKIFLKNAVNLTDSQRNANLGAMIASGFIQAVRPAIENTFTRGVNYISRGYLGESTAKQSLDLAPIVILLSTAYLAGIPCKADTIAGFMLRGLAQLGIEKSFYPEVQTKLVEKETWKLSSKIVVTRSNIDHILALDPTGVVTFEKGQGAENSESVAIWEGMTEDENNPGMFESFGKTTALAREGIYGSLTQINANKDLTHIIYPNDATNLILNCENKALFTNVYDWWNRWSNLEGNQLDVLTIQGIDEEELNKLLLEQKSPVMNKIYTLCLQDCSCSVQFLSKLKFQYPNICAFDVRGSQIGKDIRKDGDASKVGMKLNTVHEALNALLRERPLSSGSLSCIVIDSKQTGGGHDQEIETNLWTEIERLNKELIEKVWEFQNKQGSKDKLSAGNLIPDKKHFPACVFVKEAHFLKGVKVDSFSPIVRGLKENFPFLESLDLSYTPIRFTYIKELLTELPVSRLILISCGNAFTKKKGKDKDAVSFLEALTLFSNWIWNNHKEITLDISAAPFYQGEYKIADENPEKRALEFSGKAGTVDTNSYHQFIAEFVRSMRERKDKMKLDATLIASSREDVGKILPIITKTV